MKCRFCNRLAKFHMILLIDGKPDEYHLCEVHVQEYLGQAPNDAVALALASQIAQQMAAKSGPEVDTMHTDEETCPNCGTTFFEFRSLSRLGCPLDYDIFQDHLETILMNIHGDIRHHGKVPAHSEEQSRRCASLIRMRREISSAVREERFEQASILRDQIKNLEQEAGLA